MKRLTVVAVLSVALPATAEPSFTEVGPAPNTFGSNAYGVSGDGTVVVGTHLHDFANADEAYRWTAEGGVVRPGFDFFASRAFAVSADGLVAVGWGSLGLDPEINLPLFDRAIRWTESGGMVDLGDLPGGEVFANAEGVSGSGSIVVGRSSSASGVEAFRWTEEGGMVGLGDFPGGSFFSTANAVSADGSTVVGSGNDASGGLAFRWTAADGMVGLGDLPGGSVDSRAYGVSGDGSLVVGDSVILGTGHREAFIWDEANHMRPLKAVLEGLGLDLTGWRLSSARAISTDGTTIVGYGQNPDDETRGWVAVIPEPGHVAGLASGLAALAGLDRRRSAGKSRRSPV